MADHSHRIDGADLGFDLVLFYALRDLAWMEPEPGEPGGWEGRAELVAAQIGGLPLTVPHILLLVADRRITDPAERERDAWTWVYRRQKEAWTEWSEGAATPAETAAEERYEMDAAA